MNDVLFIGDSSENTEHETWYYNKIYQFQTVWSGLINPKI